MSTTLSPSDLATTALWAAQTLLPAVAKSYPFVAQISSDGLPTKIWGDIKLAGDPIATALDACPLLHADAKPKVKMVLALDRVQVMSDFKSKLAVDYPKLAKDAMQLASMVVEDILHGNNTTMILMHLLTVIAQHAFNMQDWAVSYPTAGAPLGAHPSTEN